MRRVDISLFLDNFEEGGVQRAFLNLAKSFIARNFEVDLVLLKVEGSFLDQIPDELRVVDLDNPRLRASIFVLANYLRREKPKALLASLHFSTEIAILAKHIAGVSTKVVVCEHGSLEASKISHFSVRNLPGFLGLTPYNATTLVRYLYRFADEVVGVSKGTANDVAEVMGCPSSRVKVIYNPVITSELIEKAKKSIQHPWFQQNQPPVILAAGRLVEQKDFPMLIRAFSQIKQSISARLMILGTGPDRSHLERLIQQLGLEADVAMPGFVENPYAYMAKSAVFAMSSAWEGLPFVLIEAMATGVPVVSTDCKHGPAEILDDGKYGALVPVGNQHAMEKALLKALSGEVKPADPNWLEQFTVENVALQYLNVLGITIPDFIIMKYG